MFRILIGYKSIVEGKLFEEVNKAFLPKTVLPIGLPESGHKGIAGL